MVGITKEQLIDVLAQVEANGPFPSRQAVWRAVAETPMAREAGLTANALKARARAWGIESRTPPMPGAARRQVMMGRLVARQTAQAPGGPSEQGSVPIKRDRASD
jgi:hypothetical protein